MILNPPSLWFFKELLVTAADWFTFWQYQNWGLDQHQTGALARCAENNITSCLINHLQVRSNPQWGVEEAGQIHDCKPDAYCWSNTETVGFAVNKWWHHCVLQEHRTQNVQVSTASRATFPEWGWQPAVQVFNGPEQGNQQTLLLVV